MTAGRVVIVSTVAGERRVMAKRSPHSFKKWQKEVKRKQKAQEKMARRQSKKAWADDANKLGTDVGTAEGANGGKEAEGVNGGKEEG